MQYQGFNENLFQVLLVLKIVFKPTLINVGLFGNKVRHLHWHIIPRYEGDSNWGGVPWPNNPLYLSAESYGDLAKKIGEAFKGIRDAR